MMAYTIAPAASWIRARIRTEGPADGFGGPGAGPVGHCREVGFRCAEQRVHHQLREQRGLPVKPHASGVVVTFIFGIYQPPLRLLAFSHARGVCRIEQPRRL